MDELTLRRAAGAYRLSQAIYAMAELGIADHLADGPRSSDDLAAAVGASEPHLRRLLRALASEGILGETEDGRFTAGDVGALLVRGRGVREMVLGWSVLPASYEAFAQLAASVRSGHSAFELAHGMDFHEYLARHESASAAYDAAVESTVSSFEAAAESYSFGDFEVIVDVGGGGGGLLTAVLKRYERPRGILFDLPAVIDGVRASAPAEPAWSRIDLVAGDFFEGPLPAGDLYVLCTVLRLFEDDRAVRLLEAIETAMRPGGKVLAIDWVHPPGPLPAPYGLADLHAMAVYGGRDRSEREFAELFRRARLKLLRVAPHDPPFSMLEAERAR